MIEGAGIVATDMMVSNGVIHVIDSVILPPANAAAPAATAAAPAAKDIVATAVGAGQFNTLVAAVKAAGLVELCRARDRSRSLPPPMRLLRSCLRARLKAC